VKDLERTLKFYTEGLGFSVDYQDEENRMAIITTNTKDCAIGFMESGEVVPITTSTVFEVEDVEQAVRTLSARGVVFTGEIQTIPGFVKLAAFKDPDGHCFELSQTLVAS
jgi:predicted enzyme related to lactoylglutathione lyase